MTVFTVRGAVKLAVIAPSLYSEQQEIMMIKYF
jgi:hypothetical protein